MSNYTNRQNIELKLPARTLLEALDDDGDGVEDAGLFDALAVNCSGSVDALLGEGTEAPASLRQQAADVFLLALLYRRRGIADAANPWAKAEAEWTRKLSAIAKGEEPLNPKPSAGGRTVSVIGEAAKTHDAGGRLIL